MAAASRPVSRSDPRRASTSEPRQGWEVTPLMGSMAASKASTPASTAARMVAPAMPEVSWVCRWMGMPTACFSSVTSLRAAAGLSSPAMSLIARMWQPAFSSCLARST